MKKLLPLLIILLLALVACDDGHTCDFGGWHILEAPTCTAEGREYRSCDCGETESRAVAVLPHDLISVEAKPVTCTDSGYAAFEYCEDCSYTTFAGELPATHDIATVAAKAPTCIELGHEAYEYCKRCENYNTYREIPATGHIIQGVECSLCTIEFVEVGLPGDVATLADGVYANYFVAEGSISILTIFGNGAIPDFDTSPFSDLSPTHLHVDDGITGIGKNAFSGMSTLVSVTVGSSVRNIGDGAFADCYRITEVINESPLPISYGDSYGQIARYASYVTTSAGTRVKFIGDFAFYVSGTNYTLVSYIGNAENLTLPTISDAATYVVRNYAFYDLDFLLSVEIGEHVAHVGQYAFEGCDNLN